MINICLYCYFLCYQSQTSTNRRRGRRTCSYYIKKRSNFINEISNLKQEVETKNAPNIEAKFELLSDANMPNGINRYRIVKKTIN